MKMKDKYPNIIIFGSARAGKSTLAYKISKILPYQIIHVDALRDSFFKIFPELGIGVNTAVSNQKFQDFLIYYLNEMKLDAKGKFGYVLEGLELSLETIEKSFINNENIIVGLGLEDITSSEFSKKMKEHDTIYDWTYHLTPQELEDIAKEFIDLTTQFKSFCHHNNLPFYNTAYNREEIFKTIIEDISKKIKN